MSDEADNHATIESFSQEWNDERLDDAIEMYAPNAWLRHLLEFPFPLGTGSPRAA